MVGLAPFLVSCVTTTPTENNLIVGQVYHGVVSVNNNTPQIPLPDGDWILMGSSISSNNTGQRFAHGILGQFKNNTLDRAAYFGVALDIPSAGWIESKFCERDNIHFIQKTSNYRGGDQDCWGVNHYRLTLTANNLPPYMEQARDYVISRKISLPLNTIIVQYRHADHLKLLDLTYHFNPENEGFSPPAQAEWSSSDWHRDRAYMDERKMAFIAKIKSWGEGFKTKVEAGFKRQLSSVQMNQPSQMNKETPVGSDAGSDGDLTNRLSKLKSLYEQKLITKEEYAKRKKEILDQSL
ncbi:MAG: SHOCT domain-containing protein [Candidatus Pacebacteria bacterium]|nr:SHOCT domain-containing protein [Candidatus Paceibacterota bacterium]